MAKKKNKKLLYLFGGGAILAAAILALRGNAQQQATTTTTTPPALPPGAGPVVVVPPTYVPPTVTPLKVGDKVTANKHVKPGSNNFGTGFYTDGGGDGHGGINAGQYAGVVTVVDPQTPYVRVSNYTFPMKSGSMNIYDYWIKKSDLNKA